MALAYRYLRFRLRLSEMGLLPTSKLALITWYLVGMDAFLFVLHTLLGWIKPSYGQGLGGWVNFLTFVAVALFALLAFRWLKAKVLWRLRNRLIVTYIFIGFIPLVLLVALALGSLYLFGGQFATFVVTSELHSELSGLAAANSAIAHHLAAESRRLPTPWAVSEEALRRADKRWANRQVYVWLNQKLVIDSSATEAVPVLPTHLPNPFRDVVRDHDQLFLRVLETVPTSEGNLTVLSSEPFDQRLLQDLAANLGEITLYEGLSLREVDRSQPGPNAGTQIMVGGTKKAVLDTSKALPTFSAGTVPPPTRRLDPGVRFATAVSATDWDTGGTENPAGITVQTRVSKLYERLFAAQGDFAPAVEFGLLAAVIFFAIIEVLAIWIGTHLTRTVTGAVAQLYDGTQRVNRGDFSHRIPVKSQDQVATLSTSFNSMTASLEKLI